MPIWVVEIDGETRVARGSVEAPTELLDASVDIDRLLVASGDELTELLNTDSVEPVPDGARVLAPVGGQEIWAAGVTYKRSRDARKQESGEPDSYDRVYDAQRPELFMKAAPGRARGPGQPIGVRADSGWDVPEPELAVAVNPLGQVVAYTIGNDVSSRRIEGENPLYLPQAKMYRGSCALGPCLVPIDQTPPPEQMQIMLEVSRAGTVVYTDEVDVVDMRRSIDELVQWLYRAQDFPLGVVLMTGTAIVPDDDFTLRPDDVVSITINGLGRLSNPVELVETSDVSL